MEFAHLSGISKINDVNWHREDIHLLLVVALLPAIYT